MTNTSFILEALCQKTSQNQHFMVDARLFRGIVLWEKLIEPYIVCMMNEKIDKTFVGALNLRGFGTLLDFKPALISVPENKMFFTVIF